MALMDWIKRRPGLTLETVRREAIRLDIRERQKLHKLEQMEKERETIFERGSKERSPVRRRQLARQYEMRSRGVQQLERELAILGKEITTIGALRAALERSQVGRDGVSKLLSRMNEAELSRMLEDDKISTEMYLEKLGDVMGVVHEEARQIVTELGSEGNEVMNVWQKMDEGEIESFEAGMKEARDVCRPKLEREMERGES
jgi:hypothetical protein